MNESPGGRTPGDSLTMPYRIPPIRSFTTHEANDPHEATLVRPLAGRSFSA